jgi:hypothetical protein
VDVTIERVSVATDEIRQLVAELVGPSAVPTCRSSITRFRSSDSSTITSGSSPHGLTALPWAAAVSPSTTVSPK